VLTRGRRTRSFAEQPEEFSKVINSFMT